MLFRSRTNEEKKRDVTAIDVEGGSQGKINRIETGNIEKIKRTEKTDFYHDQSQTAEHYKILKDKNSTTRHQPQPAFFTQIVGIDLMRSKIVECRLLMDIIQKSISEDDEEKMKTYIFEEDFLNSYNSSESEGSGWSDADVVYACATCFADDVLIPLLDLFRNLKKGAHVILIDRMGLSDNFERNSERSCTNDIKSSSHSCCS